jgi:tRNA1Val (adenine37-N6)-methyltransferase
MTTINLFPTFHYDQPSEYHFSHDSVFLARWFFEKHKNDLQHKSLLDLCSGCGIIGLDLLFHCIKEGPANPNLIDFLEVQEIYKSFFEKNANQLPSHQTQLQFLLENYKNLSLSSQKTYDFILSNPPYFSPASGLLSASEFKNRCRFFLDASFTELIEFTASALARNGNAYLLTRSKKTSGMDPLQVASEALKKAQFSGSATIAGDIRGNLILHIHKF